MSLTDQEMNGIADRVAERLSGVLHQPRKPERRFYSVDEAATFLNVAPGIIRNGTGRKSKKKFPVPFKRMGGRVVFDIKDLREFADSLRD